MALDLDARQEITTACRNLGELAAIMHKSLLHNDIPENLAHEMMLDWWRASILPGLRDDPFESLQTMIDAMLKPKEEE